MLSTHAATPRFLLAAILVIAFLLRVPLIAELPLEFASARQYHSATIARAFYLQNHTEAAPAWQREAAADYVAQATIPEALIVERIAAAAYGATGGERLWIPRLLAAAYWLAAAGLLYGAARRLTGSSGGLVAVAVFLFLPYSLGASLSFQPDTLAVTWMCAAFFALVRYSDTQGSGWIVAAIAAAMAAAIVRPMTACFVFPVMATVVWRATADSALARAGRIAAYLAMSAAPAAAYFTYRLTTDDAAVARAGGTFVPALLIEPAFWRGWAGLAWSAFGPVVFLAALAGAFLVARDRARAILASLWIGYAAYGVAFDLHVSTHPYYQTLAVPIVALSLAPIAARLPAAHRGWRVGILPAAVSALLVAAAFGQGALPANPDVERVRDYEAVGRMTGHSRRVVFLSDNWGIPLRYHAGIAGRYWPARFEIEMYRPLGSSGIPDIDAAARLNTLSRQIGGVEYFVATDLVEFDRQPDLRLLLDRTHRLVERTNRRAVYAINRQP